MDIGHYFVPSYHCVLNMKHVWTTDRLLKYFNILQVEIDKNPTTALYSKVTNPATFLDKKKKRL